MAAISQAVANYKVTAGAKGCRGGGASGRGRRACCVRLGFTISSSLSSIEALLSSDVSPNTFEPSRCLIPHSGALGTALSAGDRPSAAKPSHRPANPH